MNIGRLPFNRLHEFTGFITSDTADMLASAPDYVLLAAVDADTPIGLLAALLDIDETRIASLFVAPAWRRRGVGSALVGALALGSELMRGHVTCSFLSEAPAAFFTRMGFSVAPNPNGAGAYITTLGRLSANPLFHSCPPPDKQITPLYKTSSNAIIRYMTRYQNTADTYMPPFSAAQTDTELSHALVVGGEIQGMVICSRRNDGLAILWVHFNPSYVRHMPVLLRSVYYAAREQISPDARVYFNTIHDAGRKLAERFADGAEFTPQYEASSRLNALRVLARTHVQRLNVLDGAPEWFINEIGGV